MEIIKDLTEEQEQQLFNELESMTKGIFNSYSLITADLTNEEIDKYIKRYFYFFNFDNQILIKKEGLELLKEYVKQELKTERDNFIKNNNIPKNFFKN